jgi:polyisoprenoid-binding protein YceI
MKEIRSMHRSGLVLALCWLVVAPPAYAEPARFALDPEHTSITFFANHLGFAEVAGMFLKAEGSFTFDEATGELSDLRVRVRTDSLFTGHERRDQHLRSADFLNVAEFPEMVFEGRSAEPLTATTGRVTGDLTLRGVTRPATLDVVFNKGGRYPFLDEHYAIGIDARGTIRRSDFGMTYGSEWIGDEIRIVLGFEAIRQE